MALAARLGPLRDRDGRQADRNRLRLDTSLAEAGDAPAIDVVLHDLSAYGFLAQTDAQLPVGGDVWLELTGVGRLPARIRWQGSSVIGCEFDAPITPHALATALKESRVVWPNFPANRAGQAASGEDTKFLAVAPHDEVKWPRWQRATFIVGSSVILWLLVILAIRALGAAIG